MKMLAWILLTGSLHAAATSHSQGVTLHLDGAPLKSAFAEITRQTTLTFLYTEQLIRQSSPVTVQLDDATLEQAVTACLRDQPISWQIVNNTIVLSQKRDLRPADSTKIISGVVRGSGSPLAGASVSVRGSNRGTVTDNSGSFSLRLRAGDRIVVITSVGFEQREIDTKDASVFSIVLEPAVSKLDEAVVIAYGSTTRRMNTGNVGRVGAKEIERQPVSNVLSALQGRIPGLLIQQTTGNAGGSFNVQVRGRNSLRTGASEPLYLVDGVPYPSGSVASGYTSEITRGGSPLHFLNPADIASIEVLKDADATAIYGSRGANGVILITTKKGREGRTSVVVDASRGFGKVARKMKMLNTRQYLDMRYEAFANDGVDWRDVNADARDLQFWDTTRNTDWQKRLIGGTARFDRFNMTFSGGSDRTQFLIGTGYSSETTVTPGDFSDEKKSIHFDINHGSSDGKFSISLSGSYVSDRNNLAMQDVTSYALRLTPMAPEPLTSTGEINWEQGRYYDNPFSYLKKTYRAANNNLVFNGFLKYEVLKNLVLKVSGGLNNISADEKNIAPSTTSFPIISEGGSAMVSFKSIKTSLFEPQIAYTLSTNFGSFEILSGATIQRTTQNGHTLLATGFSSDALLENLQAAPSILLMENAVTDYRYQALFARLTYNLKSRYLISLTARRDGSSRFGPGRQFANFGAAGVGWIFSEEPFFREKFSLFSFGKVRASYGVTGSDQINDYGFLDLWRSTAGPYDGVSGLYPGSLFNPLFAWETNRKAEVGVELGLMKDKILLSVSYYNNRSGNQLVGLPMSAVTGFTSIQSNLPAKVQNKGYEIEVSIAALNKRNFKWTPSLNLSFARNKLLEYPNLKTSVNANRFIVGQPLSIIKVYEGIGVDPGTGFFTVNDADKDGHITPQKDRTKVITTTPRLYGGLGNAISCYGIELDIFLQFVKQDAPNYLNLFVMPGYESNQPIDVLNHWSGNQPRGENQQYSVGKADAAYTLYGQSSKAYTDASFVRLKNISLSYVRFHQLSKRLHIQQLKLFLTAQNIATFTKYRGLDPETFTVSALPPLKMMAFGIQVTI